MQAVSSEHGGQLSYGQVSSALKRLGVIVDVSSSQDGNGDAQDEQSKASREDRSKMSVRLYRPKSVKDMSALQQQHAQMLLTAPSFFRLVDKSGHKHISLEDFIDVVRADPEAPWLKSRAQTFEAVAKNTFHEDVRR